MKAFILFAATITVCLLLVYANILTRVPLAIGLTNHAFNGNADSCGKITVDLPTESPACGSKIAPAGSTSYANTVTIHVTKDISTQTTFHWDTFWCADGSLPCVGKDHKKQGMAPASYSKLSAGTTLTFSATRSSDNGLACGSVQNDFWFTYNNGKCGSHFNGGFGYGALGVCQFWNGSMSGGKPVVSCNEQPTATPTQTPTSAPTETPQPTEISTPTPEETVVPTEIPTQTPAPTEEQVIETPTPAEVVVNENTQTQTQTQENNQTVNITQTPQVLSAQTSVPSELPSTGVPVENIAFLVSLFPAGILLRKKS